MNTNEGEHIWTGDYDSDVAEIERLAQKPVAACNYYSHANYIRTLYNHLIQGTDRAEKFPTRIGLQNQIYNELFPIAFFCDLHFRKSDLVSVEWKKGNQNYDAIVADNRKDSSKNIIKHLEITTLQDQSDAQLLDELSKGGVTIIGSKIEAENFNRKLALLEKALNKKSSIEYPEGTALLVYLDEDRFQKYSFGLPTPTFDWKRPVAEIVEKSLPTLSNFSEIFVFNKKEIVYPKSDS